MSSVRLRYSLLAVLLLVTAPLGATALAASTSATKATPANKATLTLSVKAKRALARQHVALRALKPATRRQSSYGLTETSGKWNYVNATGTLHFKGVLALVVKKRKVKINSVTFTRPAKGAGKLTAKVAGHQVKLFTITGKPKVKRTATSETISGLTAKLTKVGANRVNKALRRKAVKNGQGFGSFTVTVSTSPITTAGTGTGAGPGAGAPGVTGAASTGAGVQFLPAFRSLLDSAGLSVVPLIPGSNGLPAPLGTTTIPGADGSSLTLPLNGATGGGSFNQGTLTGTIPLSGGMQLDNGAISLSLTNPTLTLGTGTEGSGLSFEVNGGPEVKLFDIDTSQLEQAATPNGTLSLQGLLATLSSEGASTLNTLLGQSVFTTGQPVGGLSVILPQPPQ
jgi:hypothetical protein